MGDKGELLEDLRKRVADVEPIPGEPDFFNNAETLMRYLKAREWNVEEAEKQLKATIEWRKTTLPREVDCRWCHERPGFHCMRQVGFDELGRPVIYSCFAQAGTNKNVVEDSLAHVTYLIESAKLTMPPGIHNWVFIMDCTGMTVPACNPKLGYGVTQVLSTHYPERLGMAICINHNPVFQGVWKAIKVFLHPATAAKLTMVRGKSKIREVFERHFNDELTTWLTDEIALNKQKHLAASQRTFWAAPEDKNAHDPRGTSSYITKYLLPYKKDKSNLDQHRPHPNIIDDMTGMLGDVKPPSPGETRAGASAENGCTDNDEEEVVETLADLDIAEEYSIPKDSMLA